jgi:acyl carrier protein
MDGRCVIFASICQCLEDTLGIAADSDSLSEESGLLGEGIGLDSIEILKLAATLEKKFDFVIEDDELLPKHFVSLGSLIDFIEDKLTHEL